MESNPYQDQESTQPMGSSPDELPISATELSVEQLKAEFRKANLGVMALYLSGVDLSSAQYLHLESQAEELGRQLAQAQNQKNK